MINKLPQTAASVRAAGSLALGNDAMPYTTVTACNAAARRLEQCHNLLSAIDEICKQWLVDELTDREAMDLIAIELDENNEPEWD